MNISRIMVRRGWIHIVIEFMPISMFRTVSVVTSVDSGGSCKHTEWVQH